MLSKETKTRIDDARQILVGQLPLPTDQVELITITLIYKFMSDQDLELEELGLPRGFFIKDLEPYAWTKLVSNELSAEAKVTLFTQAIETIQRAQHLPQLFRDVFANTFLKFRDGRTFQLFLDTLNGFRYSHSEELGNAFEYLLMKMGSQGANGQFRTPRNIIDFVVEAVDPDKTDTILDPACGTGGFLVSAFRHIRRRYTTGYETRTDVSLSNYELPDDVRVNWGDQLSAADLQRLGKSIEGYDITPMMQRLARVNLYLHQFKEPQIHDYDTLTLKTRWKDKFSCILANPPFMTPKGGTQPHDGYYINASKTEVLFMDYILEHLTPTGKAGVIVPEGIIFQNTGDYVMLRKWLVEEMGLWAVVSLPGNVFQPYSGVKTSILLVDRALARGRDTILLLKVENDGFSLNKNRAPIAKNDLPGALRLLTAVKQTGQLSPEPSPVKAKLLTRTDFARLDAYRATTEAWGFCQRRDRDLRRRLEATRTALMKTGFGLLAREEPVRRLAEDLTEFYAETGYQPTDFEAGMETLDAALLLPETEADLRAAFDQHVRSQAVLYGTLADGHETTTLYLTLRQHLDGQREYILSIDKHVSGQTGKTSQYEQVKIADVCEINPGKGELKDWDEETKVSFLPMSDLNEHKIFFQAKEVRRLREVIKGYTCFQNGDLLLAKITPCFENGKAGLAKNLINGVGFGSTEYYVLRANENVLPEWIYQFISSEVFLNEGAKNMSGSAGQQRLTREFLSNFLIPLPPLSVQQELVAEIEQYQRVIDGCNLIIDNYQPRLEVKEEWTTLNLGDVCQIQRGRFSHRPRNEPRFFGGNYPFIQTGDVVRAAGGRVPYSQTLNEEGLRVSKLFKPTIVLVTIAANIGDTAILDYEACFTDSVVGLIPDESIVTPRFLEYTMRTKRQYLNDLAPQSAQKNINNEILKNVEIALPLLDEQRALVAELEAERAAVEGARLLRSRMQARIQGVIGRVWGR